VGDVDGDGRAELVQLWNDNGRLGMIVYHWNGNGMVTLWDSPNVGQGVGAVNWEIGDVNGDQRTELIQLWNDNGRLGVIVYGWNGASMATLSTGDVKQGPGAVDWQIGDVNGDGFAEIFARTRSPRGAVWRPRTPRRFDIWWRLQARRSRRPKYTRIRPARPSCWPTSTSARSSRRPAGRSLSSRR
jgi:hypothetical protein